MPKTPEIFSHDADGNLTRDGRWDYTWDGENRLIAMQTRPDILPPAGIFPLSEHRKLEFTYDVQGRRVSKKVSNWTGSGWHLANSTLFLYDGWNLIAELNTLNANTVVRTYVWGTDLSGTFQGAGGVGGLLFASVQTPSSSLHAPCYDGNGNVAAYVDMATGSRSATYEYGAFGETLVADGAARDQMPYRFSTKFTDDESSLLYYGLRYYSPSTGRWLSKDPLFEITGEHAEFLPEGPGLYNFIGNEPVGIWDYLGLIAGGRGGAPNPRGNVGPRRGGPGAGGTPSAGESDWGLIDKALEASMRRAFLRCYLLDMTEEDLTDMNRVLEREMSLLDTPYARHVISQLPENAAFRFLELNAAAREILGTLPQGTKVLGVIPTPQSIAGEQMNKRRIAVELRSKARDFSIKLVGKGGVKVWGRVGTKILPLVGWVSAGYEIAKVCHCVDVTKDDKFTNDEKFIGQ